MTRYSRTTTIHDPEPTASYLQGVADGREAIAKSALSRMLDAQQNERRAICALQEAKAENVKLRRRLRARWLSVGQVAIVCSLFWFLAGWNFALHGLGI